MVDNKLGRRALVVALSAVLASSLALTGCGSLTRIVDEPAPPQTSVEKVELTNILRTEKEYEGIEVFHGSWNEPMFTEDEKGYFYEERGWIYLHVEGEPAERGSQHGWLLADYIQRNVNHNTAMLADLYAIDWKYFKTNAERMWAAQVGEELKAELEGIVQGAAARGATFDYLDLLVLNGLEELRDCWFPTVQEQYYLELAQGLWNPHDQVSLDNEKVKEAADEAAATDEAATSDEVAATDEAPTSRTPVIDGESGNAASDDDAANESAVDENTASDKEATPGAESGTADDNEGAESGVADDTDSDTNDESDSPQIEYTEEEGITGVAPEDAGDSRTPSNEATALSGVFTKQASALLATGSATEDGNLLLTHNTCMSYLDSNFSNVMIDVKPQEGQRFTMQAAPGFVHSVAEAYSTESLLIANTLIKGFNLYNESGAPEFLRSRQAAQYATTLDAFKEALVGNTNGGLASSWLVGEIETGQIMELEIGLSFYNEERLSNGCFISFNGVDDARILTFETNGGGFTDIRQSAGARYLRLANLVRLYDGKLTAEIAQDIIADHFDSYTNGLRAGSRSICAHFETDGAEHDNDPNIIAHMPCGTVDAKVMTTEMAENNTILARWGSACGRAFDSAGFLTKNQQYFVYEGYLFDRPAQPWNKLYPLDEAE